MALWQFKIELIPQQWLDAGGRVDDLYEESGYDASPAWSAYSDAALQARIASLLYPGKSWSSDLTLRGSEESDDIHIWREGGRITSVGFRFDLRKPNFELMAALVAIAQELKLAILVLGLKKVVTPDLKLLIRLAGESDAAHFVLDPHSFLSQLDAANAKAT